MENSVPELTPKELVACLADNPPRVAIDVRFWNMSGLGTYVRELLTAYAHLDSPLRLTCIGPHHYLDEIPENLLIEKWIEYDRPVYHPGNLLGYPCPGDVDLFHYPHYNMPLTRVRRKLINIFDLFHMIYGNTGKSIYQRWMLRRVRWSNATVITPSGKTTDDILDMTGIPENRIHIIPPGCGRSLPKGPVEEPGEVRSLAGTPINPPWLLAVGIDQEHKNYDFLLTALCLYYQRRPDAPPLVISGMSPERCEERVSEVSAVVRHRIAFEPYTSTSRLDSLMMGAWAMVFPSLDEGFGFPPLEAMARYIPVLCSQREPMVSILGDAPLYFEPTDSASFWRMLDRLLDVDNIRDDIIRRGESCVLRYSWKKTALEVFRLYAILTGRMTHGPREDRIENSEPDGGGGEDIV
jgi:glycosyltransferase involved in cell wall biosynthesis